MSPWLPSMTYDAIMVGGSYAGLAAAMQLARARRSVLVLYVGRPRNRFARTAHGFLGQDGKAPRAIVEEAARWVSWRAIRCRRIKPS